MTFCTSVNKPQRGDEEKDLKTVVVPLGGNTYQTASDNGDGVSEEGITTWEKSSSVFSTFVKFSESTKVDVALRASSASGLSTIELSHGDAAYNIKVDNEETGEVSVGSVEIKEAGYVRFDLKGLQKPVGPLFGTMVM